MRRAFSYARFSKPEQSDGNSLRRQLEATQAYCQRNRLTLDERAFTDLGVSAYKGGNATGGELAQFIELVRDGRIPRGSVLIVENTDRLSRLPPDEASRIICDIVKAGVDIVTTSPEQVYTAANIGKLATWIPLQIACCLSHEESVKKGDRLRDAWQEKRKMHGPQKLSKIAPSWLRLTADRTGWVLVEDKVAMVRKIFRLSLEGFGVYKIAEVMNRDHPEGLKGKGWRPAFLREILRNKAVIGEFQPHVGTCAKKGGIKKTSRPVGEPVKGYFPDIISEADFYRVQAAMDGRRKGGGRVTGTPNLFNGYCYDALDGHRMVMNTDHGRRLLVSAGALRRLPGCEYRTVLYLPFEDAVLQWLTELKVADVIGPQNGAQTALQAASDRLTAVNLKIQQVQQRAATADDPTVFLDLLDDLGRQRKATVKTYEAAKGKAATEDGDHLGECQSLIRMLREAEGEDRDNLRRRVRAAMTRLIESVHVVALRPQKLRRLVGCRLQFRQGNRHRDYFMVFGPGDTVESRSFSAASLPDDLDLRIRDHAVRLERALAAVVI
jgi:DNA invertase Pin-like site-specific DNA recombinase